MLAGQREGARLERQRLGQLIQSKVREALIGDLQTAEVNKGESLFKGNHSSQWVTGFRNGVNSVDRRLGVAIASGGEEKITAELSRHFDTSEEDHK